MRIIELTLHGARPDVGPLNSRRTLGYARRMLDRQAFVDALLAGAAEAEPTLAEHLDDHDGELLLHLLLADALRLTVSAFHAGKRDLSERILNVMARGLEEGDDYVANAVAVSFVEDFGASTGESDDLLALWPPVLRRELGR